MQQISWSEAPSALYPCDGCSLLLSFIFLVLGSNRTSLRLSLPMDTVLTQNPRAAVSSPQVRRSFSLLDWPKEKSQLTQEELYSKNYWDTVCFSNSLSKALKSKAEAGRSIKWNCLELLGFLPTHHPGSSTNLQCCICWQVCISQPFSDSWTLWGSRLYVAMLRRRLALAVVVGPLLRFQHLCIRCYEPQA